MNERKYSAYYLLANSKPFGLEVALPPRTVGSAGPFVVLLLLGLPPLALLPLHEEGQRHLLPQRHVEVGDEGHWAEGMRLLPLWLEYLQERVLVVELSGSVVLAGRRLLN
jgi:hypothetical protein